MNLKKIGYNLGLTTRYRTELSDILYETAVVTSKNHQEEEDNFVLGVALGNPALGIVLSEDEEYTINFKGPKTEFELDDETTFKKFKINEKVKLGYVEKYEITSDYVPPNFDKKQQLYRTFLKNELISIDKLEK